MMLRLATCLLSGLTVLFVTTAEAESPPFSLRTVWVDEQPVPDNHRRVFGSMILLEDRWFVLVGSEGPESDADGEAIADQLIVVSIAHDGTEQWRRVLEAGEQIAKRRIVPGPDGSVFICDSTQNYYRLDAAGRTVWHVQYDYWLESTCLDMAYHSDGLLLVAGARTFGRANDRFLHREAALVAYDAADGSLRWQTGYRLFDGPPDDPNDATFDVEQAMLRIHDGNIDWLGWGYVGLGRFSDYYPWSFNVSADGTIRQETPAHKLMAERSFRESAFVTFAPHGWTLLMSNDVFDPRLVAWVDTDWSRPYHRRFDPYRTFGWDRGDDAGRVRVLGATKDSVTLLFSHCMSWRDEDCRLDFYTKQFGGAETTDDLSYSIVLSRSADQPILRDFAVRDADFKLHLDAGVYLLVTDERGRRRIDWPQLERPPTSVGGSAF